MRITDKFALALALVGLLWSSSQVGAEGRNRVGTGAASQAAAGTYLGLDADGGMRIAAGDGEIILDMLQPAGGRAMPARDFLNGTPVRQGSLITAAPEGGE